MRKISAKIANIFNQFGTLTLGSVRGEMAIRRPQGKSLPAAVEMVRTNDVKEVGHCDDGRRLEPSRPRLISLGSVEPNSGPNGDYLTLVRTSQSSGPGCPLPQTSSFPISVIMKQPHAVRFTNIHRFSQCAQEEMLPSSSKIAIIGAGSVGAAIANSLLLGKVVAEVILVDIDPAICHAQVLDLSDAEFLSNVRIKQGHHRDAGQCDIIIVSSGAKQRPGDTRLDLIGRNVKMLEQVLDAMQPIRADAILVLVANPVDVVTRFAQQLSGLPKGQVFGSGTFLDSVRLRGTLAQRLKVRGGTFPSVGDRTDHSLLDRWQIPPSTLTF
jgi:hypothetical protein